VALDGEKRLIKKLKKGKEEAYKEVLDLYGNRLLKTCYLILKDKDEAEDIVQETFLKVFRQIGAFKGDSSIYTWIYQIAINLFGSLVPDGRSYWLSTLNFHNGDNKIKGRVTVDGVGIPFVEVYIQYSHKGHSTDNNFIAITDRNGYFETIGIKEGDYDIGIGIGTPILFDNVYLDKNLQSIRVDGDMEFNFEFTSPMKVINPKPGLIVKDNKFVVEWEKVEGAEYYTVYAIGFEDPVNMKGSNMTFGLIDENREYKIRDNKAIFDLELINRKKLGSTFRTKGEIINPQAILGYFYKGAEMPIIVSAYDKEGNKLNSSIPLATYYDNVPSIKIEGMDFENTYNNIKDQGIRTILNEIRKDNRWDKK